MSNQAENKTCTRVFKKSSPNGKVTVYIGQRDYLDKCGKVDPIDGVVMADPEYLKDNKLYIHILASFRYGREDLDVLGLTFRKDLFLDFQQIYPSIKQNGCALTNENAEKEESIGKEGVDKAEITDQQSHSNVVVQPDAASSTSLTKLQIRLINKLGATSAFPFRFELPHHSPASVTLQPAPEDLGKPCGVDYELKAYIASNVEEKSNKRNTVKLAIRKLVFTNAGNKAAPEAEIEKSFKITHGHVKLAASLVKERFSHGECIVVNVRVDNESKKTIKKVKVQALQVADIMLFTRAMYKCCVDDESYNQQIIPGQINWVKQFTLCPLLTKNRQKRGLALDGKIRYEDTNLASSTIIDDNYNIEDLGIIVSYKVRVRLIFGFGVNHVQVELPFTLTHPNPEVSSQNDKENDNPDTINQNKEELIPSQAENDDELEVNNFEGLKLDYQDFLLKL